MEEGKIHTHIYVIGFVLVLHPFLGSLVFIALEVLMSVVLQQKMIVFDLFFIMQYFGCCRVGRWASQAK